MARIENCKCTACGELKPCDVSNPHRPLYFVCGECTKNRRTEQVEGLVAEFRAATKYNELLMLRIEVKVLRQMVIGRESIVGYWKKCVEIAKCTQS